MAKNMVTGYFDREGKSPNAWNLHFEGRLPYSKKTVI